MDQWGRGYESIGVKGEMTGRIEGMSDGIKGEGEKEGEGTVKGK
jgi:hypothetical protein